MIHFLNVDITLSKVLFNKDLSFCCWKYYSVTLQKTLKFNWSPFDFIIIFLENQFYPDIINYIAY